MVVTVGVPLGVGAALAAGRVVSTYLYGVSPRDPATFSGMATALAPSLFSPVTFPRDARVDPVHALRHD
jgi:hypothetical protein